MPNIIAAVSRCAIEEAASLPWSVPPQALKLLEQSAAMERDAEIFLRRILAESPRIELLEERTFALPNEWSSR